MEWQLGDAKNRFSELVELALAKGPQLVTRRGTPAVMIVSIAEFKKLAGSGSSFKKHLLNGPSFEGLTLDRDPSPARDVRL
jgi:prevent-host-death family protein